MFFALVWGSKWKYKRKENGLILNKQCPECDRMGEFFEVIPEKYFTLFWIPILSTQKKKSVFECPNCHERFYMQNQDHYSIKE